MKKIKENDDGEKATEFEKGLFFVKSHQRRSKPFLKIGGNRNQIVENHSLKNYARE